MGKYTIISDMGNALVEILRENLTPATIPNPDGIALCSPGDRGETVLCVHLYDIRESAEVRPTDMVNLHAGAQRFPSTFLSLYYMITAFSAAEVKFRSAEEQRIMGKVIQALGDNSILSPDSFAPIERAVGPAIRIQMLTLEMEEKLRLWNVPNTPAKLSVFYQVGPVEMESERVRQVQRVVDADLIVKER